MVGISKLWLRVVNLYISLTYGLTQISKKVLCIIFQVQFWELEKIIPVDANEKNSPVTFEKFNCIKNSRINFVDPNFNVSSIDKFSVNVKRLFSCCFNKN